MAWRNTRRNTRRSGLTGLAVTVAVAALTYGMAHVTGLLDHTIETYARVQSGHVRITRDGYTARERLQPMHLNVSELSRLLLPLRQHPAVEEAIPRVRASVLVDGASSNRPGLLLGVDLEREGPYLNPSGITVEGRVPGAGRPEVLVGRRFAETLEVGVGDSITILGQTAYRSLGGARLEITGLAASGMAFLDRVLLMASLDQAQDFAALEDAATEVVVFARDADDAENLSNELAAQLDGLSEDDLEVLSWEDQGPLIQTLDMVRPIFGVVLLLLLLMAGLIIINTMLMTVMERTHEFGMQAALGMRRSDIVRLILAEGLTIGLLGAVAGGALGTGVSILIEHIGINVGDAFSSVDFPIQGVVYPDWRVSFTLVSAFAGTLAAGLAALYPAWRAIRMTPAEALRS
jgi:putative ABC transport system permease protein